MLCTDHVRERLLRSTVMAAASWFEHIVDSAIRGVHIYQSAWTPVLHEQLTASQEHGKAEDQFAVTVSKVDVSTGIPTSSIVGHLLQEISQVCGYFFGHGGEIFCTVTGSKRRSPLVQGGLEIPCILRFVGEREHVGK